MLAFPEGVRSLWIVALLATGLYRGEANAGDGAELGRTVGG